MSARKAFVPTGARPASRSAQPQGQQTQKAAPHFTIDRTNPLHGVSNSSGQTPPEKHVDATPQLTMVNIGSSTHGSGEHRPLNTGSLVKRKNSAQQTRDAIQNQNASRRPAGGNAVMAPATADSNLKSQEEQNQIPSRTHIAAPIPRPAAARPSSPSLANSLASGVFASGNTATNFRMPDLPLAPTPQTCSDPQAQVDAHISTSTVGFSFSNPHATSGAQKSQLPSPPNSIRTTNSRTFVTPNPNVPLPPFALNMSLPNQSGAQRVLLNVDGSRGPIVGESQEAGETRLTLTRTDSARLKRSRADMTAEVEQEAAGNYKRHRNQEDAYSQRAKSITSLSSSPPNHTIRSRHDTHSPDVAVHDSHMPYQHQQRPLTPPDNEHPGRMGAYYHEQQEVDDGPSALDKLLGRDVNMYIEEHSDQYERAVERWKQCTMAEWVAGANEQAARFTKILDFVKDHMTAKMKLFATFDAKVDGHNDVLKAREKTLEAVKGRLVQESGNVLGTRR